MTKRYGLLFTKAATRDLAKLERSVAKRVFAKIRTYVEADDPLRYAKQLRGMKSTYRFRIGEYRAIFELLPDGTCVVLVILRIKHRKDVYR